MTVDQELLLCTAIIFGIRVSKATRKIRPCTYFLLRFNSLCIMYVMILQTPVLPLLPTSYNYHITASKQSYHMPNHHSRQRDSSECCSAQAERAPSGHAPPVFPIITLAQSCKSLTILAKPRDCMSRRREPYWRVRAYSPLVAVPHLGSGTLPTIPGPIRGWPRYGTSPTCSRAING